MRIEQFGEGDPEVAVVGGIHGDEPCGVRAIERLLENPPSVRRPVALVVANERALAAGTRRVDEDLNRAFPGDPDGVEVPGASQVFHPAHL
jgi:succinylglutamate desuccinylase